MDKRVLVRQLQALLDETDYLLQFQFEFRSDCETKLVSVALMDDLYWEKNVGMQHLVFLGLSVAFETNDHVSSLTD